MPSKLRFYAIPPSALDESVVQKTLEDAAAETGSRIHIEDMDLLGDDPALAAEVRKVFSAAGKSGVVSDIVLFNGLRFGSIEDVWPTKPVFLPPDHQKSRYFYAMLGGLDDALAA